MSLHDNTDLDKCLCCGQPVLKRGNPITPECAERALAIFEGLGFRRDDLLIRHRAQLEYQSPGFQPSETDRRPSAPDQSGRTQTARNRGRLWHSPIPSLHHQAAEDLDPCRLRTGLEGGEPMRTRTERMKARQEVMTGVNDHDTTIVEAIMELCATLDDLGERLAESSDESRKSLDAVSDLLATALTRPRSISIAPASGGMGSAGDSLNRTESEHA
jgi:hypothetical protein